LWNQVPWRAIPHQKAGWWPSLVQASIRTFWSVTPGAFLLSRCRCATKVGEACRSCIECGRKGGENWTDWSSEMKTDQEVHGWSTSRSCRWHVMSRYRYLAIAIELIMLEAL
jgi:hypothetical protein